MSCYDWVLCKLNHFGYKFNHFGYKQGASRQFHFDLGWVPNISLIILDIS